MFYKLFLSRSLLEKMNYGGVSSGENIKTNPFNMLYWSINNNSRYEKMAYLQRPKLDLSRKGYDNTYNQLPNGLNYNGRPYSQRFQPKLVSIPYRDYDDEGRNLSIFKNTNDRMVDVSGRLYKNKDLPIIPLIDSKKYGLKVLGIRV